MAFFFAYIKKKQYFCSRFQERGQWRDGGVVDRGGLENR